MKTLRGELLVSVYCENKGFDCKRWSGSSKEPLMGLSGWGKPRALSSLLTFLTFTRKFTFSLCPALAPACWYHITEISLQIHLPTCPHIVWMNAWVLQSFKDHDDTHWSMKVFCPPAVERQFDIFCWVATKIRPQLTPLFLSSFHPSAFPITHAMLLFVQANALHP